MEDIWEPLRGGEAAEPVGGEDLLIDSLEGGLGEVGGTEDAVIGDLAIVRASPDDVPLVLDRRAAQLAGRGDRSFGLVDASVGPSRLSGGGEEDTAPRMVAISAELGKVSLEDGDRPLSRALPQSCGRPNFDLRTWCSCRL